MIGIIMNYAKENNIILKLNNGNWKGDVPLTIAIKQNNMDMILTLMNYAKENNIILELNNGNWK
eukprot:jgi/Orpsp1_1/1190697/evm.model.d7180000080606.1